MSKQFWGVIVVIVLLFVGIFALSGSKSDSSKDGTKSSSAQLTNHTTGAGTTGVKLVEYGDFQCPFCERYSSTVSTVVKEYGDKITFQFRNFPLTSLHRNAFAAARAAEAASLQDKAGSQDKYWQMHEALYQATNWQDWTNSSNPNKFFEIYAGQLGLNVDQFKKDFSSTKVNDLINADMAEGNRLGITGTPTFFVNGKQVTINNDPADFKKVLDAAIAKQSANNS
jgi:protein-disulfide isomerase